ncbi:OmpH family outer membrane protein [Sphingomonas sp. ASV193]|uniref:OmpH family outer membrane protein n=1 Tax=Sphingomonas sp. ASV193 TaxID=3144405 RepID=UPI0032E84E33
MKTLILSLGLAAVLPQVAAAQNVPAAVVAIVDADRLLTTCTACRTADAQLRSQKAAIDARAASLQASLKTEYDSIDAAIKALNGKEPDAALKARATAFETKRQAAEQEIASKNEALQSTNANVQSQIAAKVNPIINAVMTQRGANLVMAKNATVSNSASLEITDAVLAELNRQLPSVSVTPLPAASASRPTGR